MAEPGSGSFTALRVPEFRILWLGTIFSFLAFFMAMIVQSVVAFEIAGDNSSVGVIVFAQGFSMVLLGPIGGAFADRWPKRRVVVVGQLLAAAVFLWTAVMIAQGALTIFWLALSSLLIGASIAFLGPSRQGMVVELVPVSMRGNAMAVNNLANTGSRVFGPLVAGLLLAWHYSGSTGTYLMMTVCYLIAAASMGFISPSKVRPGARDRPILADVVDGVGYVYRKRRLRLLVGLFTLVIFLGFPHVTILPGLAENVFGRDATAVTELFFVSAAGALLASLWVTRFGDSSRADVIYIGMALLFGFSLLGLAFAPGFRWAELAMFGIGAGSGGFQSLNAAVIARDTDPAYIGRVMSLVMLAFGGFGLMALPYGYLADWIGERSSLLMMGSFVLLVTALFSVLLRRERASRESPDPRS
ncbi:MAG: MFS transporter [Myxococcota bacterium]